MSARVRLKPADDRVGDAEPERLVLGARGNGLERQHGERVHAARGVPAAEHGEGAHGHQTREDEADREIASGFHLAGRWRRRRGLRAGPPVAQPGEVAREIARRVVPVLRLLREAAPHDPLERLGGVRSHGRKRRRLVLEDRRQRLDGGRARKRATTGRHLVQHRAEGELVGAIVDGPARRLLRGHVSDGSDDDPRLGLMRRGRSLALVVGRLGHGLGEPEVEDLHEAVRRHHDVLGLQVTVHDARGVRPAEPLRDLRADRHRPRQGQGAGREQLPQALPLDELHRDPRDASRLPDVVDRHDVRMIQRGGGARLLLEAPQALADPPPRSRAGP